MPTLPTDGQLFIIPAANTYGNPTSPRTNIRYAVCTGGVTLDPTSPAEGWIWYKEATVDHKHPYGYPLAAYKAEKTPA